MRDVVYKYYSVENPDIILHKETKKFEVAEFLEDFWDDLASLGPEAVKNYSVHFCIDPICVVTLINTRLGQDMYKRRRHQISHSDLQETMVSLIIISSNFDEYVIFRIVI